MFSICLRTTFALALPNCDQLRDVKNKIKALPDYDSYEQDHSVEEDSKVHTVIAFVLSLKQQNPLLHATQAPRRKNGSRGNRPVLFDEPACLWAQASGMQPDATPAGVCCVQSPAMLPRSSRQMFFGRWGTLVGPELCLPCSLI